MPPKKDLLGSLGRVTGANTTNTNSVTGTARLLGGQFREELEKSAEQLPIQEIALEQLQDNPFQYLARAELNEESLEELADSIRENGFFGALLARRKRGTNEQYEIAYGHRRREAARRAGYKSLPVKVLNLNDGQMARIMASENFSREDLDPIGEANVIGHLSTQQNLSAREIGEIVGRKRSWVEARLTLYQAPLDIKEMVSQKPDTFSHVPLLLAVKEQVARRELIKKVLELNLTREQLKKRLEAPEKSKKVERTQIVNSVTTSLQPTDGDEFHNLPIDQQILPENKANILLQEKIQLLNKLVDDLEETWPAIVNPTNIENLAKVVARLHKLL